MPEQFPFCIIHMAQVYGPIDEKGYIETSWWDNQ